MKEIELTDFVKLGLMPENGIAKILADKVGYISDLDGHVIAFAEKLM